MNSFGLNTKNRGAWRGIQNTNARKYTCGFCSLRVSSEKGYHFGTSLDGSGSVFQLIQICPECNAPTLFDGSNTQFPSATEHDHVRHLPVEIEKLLKEAFNCFSVNAYTSSVLCVRKILMHIGVDQGAEENKNFVYYVEYLSSKGFIPPNGKGWVDYIRTKGNEANHEIVIMSKDDSNQLLIFTVMLLKFVYELPNDIPKAPKI